MSAPAPVASVLDAIGQTPCIQLSRLTPRKDHARVFLKLENLNPTGSYKDRLARSVVEQAEQRGALKPGMTLVEATGGSTGSSFSFVCRVKGYKFRVVSSNIFAPEKLRTMAAFGAQLELVHSPSSSSSPGRGITPDLIPAMRDRARQLAAREDCYLADQFSNPDVVTGFESLGRELVEQFPRGVDGFCAAVGGGEMAMGVSRVLKGKGEKRGSWGSRPGTSVVVLEPASAPAITEGRGGPHGVEGIGIGFFPPLLDRDLYDEAWAIAEDEAREMCRRLAREEGILVGTSTGMNVVGALRLARELGPDKTVVTVACDTGLKYMNGDLFSDEAFGSS